MRNGTFVKIKDSTHDEYIPENRTGIIVKKGQRTLDGMSHVRFSNGNVLKFHKDFRSYQRGKMIKIGDLVCLKCHKSFLDLRKSHLAEAYGTEHISVGIVMSVYLLHGDANYATVLWQKKSPRGFGGPGTEQRFSAIAKL